MIERFRKKMAENGQSLKWFHQQKIKPVSNVSYTAFIQQINGFATINEDIKKAINTYLENDVKA